MTNPRTKVLRALGGHTFGRVRVATQLLTIALLIALPSLGLARFDFWRGHHLALREPTSGFMAVGWVGVAIVGFYVLTFLLNAFLGRVFCGFGCPIGEASRLADQVQAARKPRARRVAYAMAAGHSLLLAAAVLLWWVDPRVLLEGSLQEVAITLASLLAVAGVILLHGKYWRWKFCVQYCPIGLYYSAVQTDHGFGVQFDAKACDDCAVCTRVCPVGLDPKNLSAPLSNRGGLAVDDFPGAHHCLTCGDCVRACEKVTSRKNPALVALRLGFRADPAGSATEDSETQDVRARAS
jgi:polyferredoxin